MSLAAIVDRLEHTSDVLRKAMQDGDPEHINKAVSAFEGAVNELRAVGAVRSDPELKARLGVLLRRFESDQMLARLLSDLTARQLAILTEKAPNAQSASMVYGRRG